MIEVIRRIHAKEKHYYVELAIVAVLAGVLCAGFIVYQQWCIQDDNCLNRRIESLTAAGKIRS